MTDTSSRPPESKERLLICGSRDWTDEKPIFQQIRLMAEELEVVIEGGARGADRLAREAARDYGIPVLPFFADWVTHGKKAGPIRNVQMLQRGRPTLVVAFTDDFDNPRSGTRHMCRIAVEAGIHTMLVEHCQENYPYDNWSSRDLTLEDFSP